MLFRSPKGGPTHSLSAAARWARRAPLLPALIFMFIVTQLPFVVTIVVSFIDWNALYPNDVHFGFLDNYINVFTDADLRGSVVITILLTVVVVVVSTVLGLIVALLLDRRFPGRGIVRTIMIAACASATP